MAIGRDFFFAVSVIFFACTDAQSSALRECPQMYPRWFKGYLPQGNTTAGTYKEVEDVKTQKECVYACCFNEDCNVAFMTEDKCYHITCVSNELCIPHLSSNVDNINRVSMVLVRPTIGQDNWADVLNDQEFDKYQIGREMYKDMNPERFEDTYRELLQMSESSLMESTTCYMGIPSCPPHEICERNFAKSRAGTCQCKVGYMRKNRKCVLPVPDLRESAINGIVEGGGILLNENATLPIEKKNLTVTAESKEVKLPENEVSLKAGVSPPPEEGEKYIFEWISLRKPDGSLAVKNQDAEVLHLSKLSEGLYTFKVNVSSEKAYGETFVNVTVLPPSRINRPPEIKITPANQTVKLPNTGAVLDASSSTDDNGIVSYHWELQQGPVGYQPQLTDTPTLQLNDLSRPGNYTFKLTVTDTDKAISISTANITVLKITDYPPEANAGQDTIIYLPHNQITLNGNLSTDDHNITTWEWMAGPNNVGKAIDMQDTHTPFLKLSDLEEGVYTFQLKVTDSANQSSVASVRVFVKPPTNKPPIAVAGANITISLPQTWVIVDASNSSDDNKIISYKWEQVEGPSNVIFANANVSKTNVTGLTKGNYIFKITVGDDSKNEASALQYIIVNQNKNQKPVSDPGGDLTIELPRNVIYINGSKSSDDWSIVKWKWTRAESSLAIGKIGEQSDELPVLILTGMLPGKYVFNLTVSDEQGLSDTNSMTLTVKPDPKLIHLVDLTIDEDVKMLTDSQFNTLKGKLALLVQEDTKLQVRELKSQEGTEKAIIRFFVETSNQKALNANDVVHHLHEKLTVDASLLGFSVASLQTTICQNSCSGHGVCDEKTRLCICEAFWMQDQFKLYLSRGEDSDCSWSVLYVVLGTICSFVAASGCLIGIIYLCVSRCSCRNSRKPSSYKLIEDTEDLPPYNPRKADLSDTDSDSDVVFESRNKAAARFNTESRNGHKPNRNGFVKMGRRIKT